MSTVIACWSRLGKRWSLRTAAALGLCLVGAAALLYVSPGLFFVTAARPHAHAIEFAAPTVVANLPAARDSNSADRIQRVRQGFCRERSLVSRDRLPRIAF